MSDGAHHLTAMTDAWTQFTRSVFRGAMAANTAAIDAIDGESGGGVRSSGSTGEGNDPGAGGTDGATAAVPDDARPGADSVLYDGEDWVVERSITDRRNLAVGDSVAFEKSLDHEDVVAFARASGDTNRLHLDEEFAADSRFGGRIVHGTLVSGLISAALARLPGLTIYLSQDLEFRGPVPIDSRVRAHVEVLEELGDGRYRLETRVTDPDADDGRAVVDGEAIVIVDPPAE